MRIEIKIETLKLKIMETGVIQFEMLDGRIFRIVYLNSTQRNRIIKRYSANQIKCKSYFFLIKGLHTVSQFEEMIKNKAI